MRRAALPVNQLFAMASIPVNRKKRGRPPSANPKERDPLLGVRVPASLLSRLDAWAKAEGMGRPDAVRHLLTLALDRLKAPAAKPPAKAARAAGRKAATRKRP